MNEKEDEVERLRRDVSDLRRDYQIATEELSQAKRQAQSMGLPSDNGPEIEYLKNQIREYRRENERLSQRVAAPDVPHERVEHLEQQVDQLKEEKAALQAQFDRVNQELQAFDLEFFEEIEDLKYKYAQAVEKLAAYEGRRPR